MHDPGECQPVQRSRRLDVSKQSLQFGVSFQFAEACFARSGFHDFEPRVLKSINHQHADNELVFDHENRWSMYLD